MSLTDAQRIKYWCKVRSCARSAAPKLFELIVDVFGQFHAPRDTGVWSSTYHIRACIQLAESRCRSQYTPPWKSELFPISHPNAADMTYVPAGSCLLTTVVIVLTDIAFAGAVVVVKLPILFVLVLMDLHQFATSRRHCNMLSIRPPPEFEEVSYPPQNFPTLIHFDPRVC